MGRLDEIAGHARPLRVLRRALSSGRIPHAYLFWGPEGVGKELAAMGFAEVLFCKDPEALGRASACGVCSSCVKFKAGSHPDLHLLSPDEKAISVEEVRALIQNLSFQAYEKGRKVAIIRDSFRMSREGANALLKTVEEPPPATYLFLLAPHRSRLLPTLVSRCQSVRFDPLSTGDVEKVLVGQGIAQGDALRLAELSGGSPGAALYLDQSAIPELSAEAEDIALRLDAFSIGERFALSERWAKDKEGLPLRLKSLERALASLARQDALAALRLIKLQKVRDLLERNINAQLALDALFVLDVDERLEEMT